MRKFEAASILAGALAGCLNAHAQTPPPADKPAEPAPPPAIFSIGGFDLTGHIDVGYTHLSGLGKFVSGVNDRVFDFKRNDAFFHALDLQLANTPENGFGGLVDVTLGKVADRRGRPTAPTIISMPRRLMCITAWPRSRSSRAST